MQQNNNIVHCKVLYNNEFRRFPLSKGFSLADLKDKIKTLLNLDSDFFVKYKDEEDDWITISSDLELETGLSLCTSDLFRLSISVVSSTTSPSGNEIATCNDDLYVPLHRRHRRGEKRCENLEEENKSDEERDYGRYRKGRRGGCRRGKGRWNREAENLDEEDKEEDKNDDERDYPRYRKGGRRGGCRRGRGRGRWNRGWDNREEKIEDEAAELSSGTSDEEDTTLSLPEIKKEIESLKEENTLLQEKKGNLSKEVSEMKNSIKAKRQDPNASREDILNLKTELRAKKQSFKPLFCQIRSNRKRIRKLQELASNKSQ